MIVVRHSKLFQSQACLWGSYSLERILVRVARESASPVTQDWFPQGCQMEILTLENPEIRNFVLLELR